MSDTVTVVKEEELKGPVQTKHKLMLFAFGTFLENLGRSIKRVKTYEELEALGKDAEKDIEALNEEYKEEMKSLELLSS